MLFNSLSYAIFLPAVFILHWILPHRFRWVLLLTASYYFYMSWNPKYVVLIATTTLVSYACAILIERTDSPVKKKLAVLAALFVALGILYLFKYFDFSLDLLSRIVSFQRPSLGLLLPVGISFYTFQTLSYVIDVYRGEVPAEKHLGIYATFVSFFPQLVAGPIERTANLLPQIRNEKHFDRDAAFYGVRLILWGLYKKMVIADNLAEWVDCVFGNVSYYEGGSLLLAAVFFSIQIYCDFSGYSDIARGSAKLLNIDLMENFKSPYFSASIREFWSRWHISLSTWFRDYVYIPLGGNRVSRFKNMRNLLITFLISGLWHGASLTYVFWGGVHGLAQIGEKAAGIGKCTKRGIVRGLRVAAVFAFVTVAWIFFRAQTIRDAVYVLKSIPAGLGSPGAYVRNMFSDLDVGLTSGLRILLLYFLPLSVYDYFSTGTDVCAGIGKCPALVRYGYAVILGLLILVFGYAGQSSFVYFQF